MSEKASVHLKSGTVELLRRLVDRVGVDRSAKLLTVTRTVLTSALAGLALRRTTADLLLGALQALRTQPEKRAELARAEVQHRPADVFLAQCCEITPDASVGELLLFQAWERWCAEKGVSGRTPSVFEQRLLLAAPSVTAVRASPTAKRPISYSGVRLKP